jgi:hypothetical protein
VCQLDRKLHALVRLTGFAATRYNPAMQIFLLFLAATFAAFALWLAVRFINRGERWAKWTLILAVGLPVLYLGSFGPACWISSHADAGARAVSWIYYPFGRLCVHGHHLSPEEISPALRWYATVFADDLWEWSDGGDIDDQGNVVWELKWRYEMPFIF